MQADRSLQPAVTHTFFNFDDPLVGGYTPAKVALRRAVALAYDSRLEVSSVFQGEAVPAQGMIPPHCCGYDAAMRTEIGSTDMARAQALRLAFSPSQRSRRIGELWNKRMKLLGLRVPLEFAPFARLIKRALAGRPAS